MTGQQLNQGNPNSGMVGVCLRGALALIFVLSVAGTGFGQGNRRPLDDGGGARFQRTVSPELSRVFAQTGSSSQLLPVIVQFRNAPSRGQLQRIATLAGGRGQSFSGIRGGVFNLPVIAIRALANDPEVAYISPDRPVRGAADYAEATVGADVAQGYGWDGSGVTVAVIDSGINNHTDLRDASTGQSRIVYSETFVPGTGTSDQYGHGTHVAGIIAGNASKSGGRGNPLGIYGVAPNVKLVNLKVLDANGSGKDSYVIAALQRAIALKDTYNIRVVNLSLGRPVYESYRQDPLCQTVEAAWRAGLVVVVAAGNQGRNNDYGTNGYGMIAAPGNDPYAITVGAMNSMNTPLKADDVIASYSSKGPSLVDHVIKPDLVAPGNRVASLLVPSSRLDDQFPQNEVSPLAYGYGPASSRQYFRLSGTSMATPVVSGAAALMLQKDPSLTPDAVKARLMRSADKSFPAVSQVVVNGVLTDSQYDIFTVGAGYLNVPNALASTDAIQGTALSPVAMRDGSGTVSLVADASSVWSNSVIWGTSVVWGNVLLSGTSVIWGSSVVWGNSTLDGCSVIWGTSVVWGTSLATNDAGNDALNVDGYGDDTGQ